MTTLTLERLAEIEQIATAGIGEKWIISDPATVAALCKIARAAVEWERMAVLPSEWDDFEQAELDLSEALRAAGLIA